MDYYSKDIYSWGTYSAEIYPRSSIAIRRTVPDVVNFCCQVTWTLRTTSSGVAHTLITVHYTLWSALPGLPSPNMTSLDHSGSRTTTSGLWQSTPSDISSAWQVFVRVLQWFQQDGATHHTSNESLAWLQQRFPDRLISRRCDP